MGLIAEMQQTPTSIHLGCLTQVVHDMLVTSQNDDHDQASDQTSPTLVSEDVHQERASLADRGAIAGNRCRHRVVSSNTHAKENAEDGQVDQGSIRRKIILGGNSFTRCDGCGVGVLVGHEMQRMVATMININSFPSRKG